MTVLTRKISRAKWHRTNELGAGEIPADAMSADLRTTGNALSFWSAATGEEDDLRRVVLALAAAADRADRMDVAWVEETSVRENEIAVEQTPGRTPVANLRNNHVNLVRLDVRRLGKVAELISEAIGNLNHRRMTRKQVVSIVVEGVRCGLVALIDLQPHVREEVQKALDRAG